jgi:hypothetical protein
MLDKSNTSDIRDMVSFYVGLVVVDQKSNIVCLVHHTTQDYFEQKGPDWFVDASTRIASACLSYTPFDPFESGRSPNNRDFEARLADNIFSGLCRQIPGR